MEPGVEVEEDLAELIHEHGRPSFWFHRRPLVVMRAWQLIRSLPVLRYRPGDPEAAAVIEPELHRPRLGLNTPLQQVILARRLTDDACAADAPVGLNRTSRKKARRAERQGVTWTVVVDPAQRESLLELAMQHERTHHDEQYRNPDSDLRHLLDLPHWYAAHHEGRPVLLAVMTLDGDSAMLAYFRGLTDSDSASNARYLMSQVVADQARRLGARHLYATGNPLKLPGGLLHFARSTGYRIFRVEVH